MTVETLIGVGQLGALVTIAHRLGSLRTDMDGVKKRMKRVEKEVFNHVRA